MKENRGRVGENFVPVALEADRRRLFSVVKVTGRHGFFHVPAQVFPMVGPCKNALRQGYGIRTW